MTPLSTRAPRNPFPPTTPAPTTPPVLISPTPPSAPDLPIMDGDELIASVYRKIEREKALIAAASNMRLSTDNPLVQQRVDANIRDGRKNIAYLEEKMQELQIRRMGQEGGGSPQDRRAQGQGPGPTPPPKDYPGYFGDQGEGDSGYPQGGAGSMPSGAPFPDPRPYAPIPKPRPNYTKLGACHAPLLPPVAGAGPPGEISRDIGMLIFPALSQILSNMTLSISEPRFSSCCPNSNSN